MKDDGRQQEGPGHPVEDDQRAGGETPEARSKARRNKLVTLAVPIAFLIWAIFDAIID